LGRSQVTSPSPNKYCGIAAFTAKTIWGTAPTPTTTAAYTTLTPSAANTRPATPATTAASAVYNRLRYKVPVLARPTRITSTA